MGKTKTTFLPYGRQHISPEDIDAVVEILQSDWLTQGPTIAQFEAALAARVGAREAVACATGTAALHLAMLALGIGPGDTVVTTPNTFLADANCARFVGADVVFADIDPETGNMDPERLARIVEADHDHAIKAVIPVHFAGQPADLPNLHRLTAEHGATLIDDACHALGATYQPDVETFRVGCGKHSAMSVYSFHPVKHVATGEGGAVATNDPALAERLRQFRNHGMTRSDFAYDDMALGSDGSVNPWYYEMPVLGYNYRLTDIQAALGLSQLKRLDWSLKRRNEVAFNYHRLMEQMLPADRVRPLKTKGHVVHAYHLFVLRIDFEYFGVSRAQVMNRLREAGIGTQVHYIPVPLQPYYREMTGARPGDFPGAEAYYAQALSLPMYPDLTDTDCDRVMSCLTEILTGDKKGDRLG